MASGTSGQEGKVLVQHLRAQLAVLTDDIPIQENACGASSQFDWGAICSDTFCAVRCGPLHLNVRQSGTSGGATFGITRSSARYRSRSGYPRLARRLRSGSSLHQSSRNPDSC